MNNHLVIIDFLLLQFLWILRVCYDGVISLFKRTPLPDLIPPLPLISEKRHFIQLFTTDSKKTGSRPICYMDVMEIDSSDENQIRKMKQSNELKRNFLKHKPDFSRSKSDGSLQRFCWSNMHI